MSTDAFPAINPNILTESRADWPLEDLSAMGYRGIEVALADTLSDAWLLRSTRLGLPVICVNALPDLTPYLGGSLSDAVAWRRRRTLQGLERAMGWMKAKDVPYLIVAPSRLAENYQSEEEARMLMVSSLRELASQGDVDVLLEAVPFRLFSSSAEISSIIDEVDLPNVAAALDVGHAMLAGESPLAAADALGPRLRYIQIRDVGLRPGRVPLDQHLPLGSGSIEMPMIRDIIKKGPWSVCISAPESAVTEAKRSLMLLTQFERESTGKP